MTNTAEYLSRQYCDAGNLNARISLHSRFSTNSQGWMPWILEHVQLQPGARILEVGCGTGTLWEHALNRGLPPGCQITLTDSSPGMLAEAQANLEGRYGGFRFEVASAQALPYPDASFDIVIANHMLYHVPDLPAGLAELRRVLRPGGRFYASTIGETHLAEIADLVHEFEPGNPYETGALAQRFGLENGAGLLAPYFSDLTCRVYEDGLVVRDAHALAAYVGSLMRTGWEFSPHRLEEFERFVEAAMAKAGAIHVRKSQGLFQGVRP